MADLKLEINDGVAGNDKLGGAGDQGDPTATWKTYTVTSEVPLHVNGQLYPKGSQVRLDDLAAQNFAALGDIQTQQEPQNEQPA